jgi:hypothetical protein
VQRVHLRNAACSKPSAHAATAVPANADDEGPMLHSSTRPTLVSCGSDDTVLILHYLLSPPYFPFLCSPSPAGQDPAQLACGRLDARLGMADIDLFPLFRLFLGSLGASQCEPLPTTRPHGPIIEATSQQRNRPCASSHAALANTSILITTLAGMQFSSFLGNFS